MAFDPARVKAPFQAAIELTDPGERRAHLDREAGGDAVSCDRLDALVAAYDQLPGEVVEILAPEDSEDGLGLPAGREAAPILGGGPGAVLGQTGHPSRSPYGSRQCTEKLPGGGLLAGGGDQETPIHLLPLHRLKGQMSRARYA